MIKIKTLRNILSKILAILNLKLKYTTESFRRLKQVQTTDEHYIEVGKQFEDTLGKIINNTSVSLEDCVEILNSWADKDTGLLALCKPNKNMLREYANCVGNHLVFMQWVADRKNKRVEWKIEL